jgi:hypothetical protein
MADTVVPTTAVGRTAGEEKDGEGAGLGVRGDAPGQDGLGVEGGVPEGGERGGHHPAVRSESTKNENILLISVFAVDLYHDVSVFFFFASTVSYIR